MTSGSTCGADPALLMRVAEALTARRLKLVTVESCTGGGVAHAATELAGSSAWFDRGWVTYTNRAKTEMVGVPASLIETHGAVSEPVARAMASGALARAGADRVAVALTGIAGPGGGVPRKPVGTVFIAWATRDAVTVERCRFAGDRAAVRRASIGRAFEGVLAILA